MRRLLDRDPDWRGGAFIPCSAWRRVGIREAYIRTYIPLGRIGRSHSTGRKNRD
jgi:hypothetical protein